MVAWSSTFAAMAFAATVPQIVVSLPATTGPIAPTPPPESATDPCQEIAGKKHVKPSQVAACYSYFPFKENLRDNIVNVIGKTLNFHASTNYQIRAPEPYSDVHVDLQWELGRIQGSTFENDFCMHKEISSQVKRLNDGHCVYINYCYDSTYVTYLPFPLVLLNDMGIVENQDIYIAPEAFELVSTEFKDYLDEWQEVAGFKFEKYAGARVTEIDGRPPWDVVEENVNIVGGYQSRATRQNSYFASYQRAGTEWTYRMGDFASRGLPHHSDHITLKVIPKGSSEVEELKVPFVSRFADTFEFKDATEFWNQNCVAKAETNGVDYWAGEHGRDRRIGSGGGVELVDPTPRRFSPPIPIEDRKHAISSFIDASAAVDITLPPRLTPGTPISGNGTAMFYMLEENVGVLALGSFSTGLGYSAWFETLKSGIVELKNKGATRLIVDVTNNGGGYICVAHFLHRLLAGPSSATEPQAGFDTKARHNPLASAITKWIADGHAPERDTLLYDPVSWKFANSTTRFPPDYNWMEPPVKEVVNGREDAFSQRIGDECQPFPIEPLAEAPFAIENIGIITNGRCASSCAIFTINMVEKHATKIAVMGGKRDVQQMFAGIVGGQSTSFTTIQSEVKSTHLDYHQLAPPNFVTDSYQGLTWRLGFGLFDPAPAEWAPHQAEFNWPFSVDTINNPEAIWKDVAKRFWPEA